MRDLKKWGGEFKISKISIDDFRTFYNCKYKKNSSCRKCAGVGHYVSRDGIDYTIEHEFYQNKKIKHFMYRSRG
jgi:hypothetical protein